MIMKTDLSHLILPLTQNPFFKEGQLNVIAWMPCPLKVPFKQLINAFLNDYNAKDPEFLINCPDIVECPADHLDEILKNAQTEAELPDVLITSSYTLLFSERFYDRIIKQGIMNGYTDEQNLHAMPDEIRQLVMRYNLGVIAFSSWSIVQDLSVKTNLPTPKTWAEIVRPEYQDQLTIHGCHGKEGSATLMLFLQQQAGEKAVENFAHNIIDIRHFSQIIKRMGSTNPYRTAFNLLPDVAVSHIPSNKPVKILSLQEGQPLNPMILMVKSSKAEAVRPVVEMFHTDEFRKMLAGSSYFMPDAIDWNKKFVLPNFETLTRYGFEKVSADLEKVYQGNLRHELIDQRLQE